MQNNVASQYETIRRLMEEVVSERPIALAHVSSNILHDDIRCCTYHSHHSIWLTEDDAKRWEVEYLKEKHEELVLELARISSPHYLDINYIFHAKLFQRWWMRRAIKGFLRFSTFRKRRRWVMKTSHESKECLS